MCMIFVRSVFLLNSPGSSFMLLYSSPSASSNSMLMCEVFPWGLLQCWCVRHHPHTRCLPSTDLEIFRDSGPGTRRSHTFPLLRPWDVFWRWRWIISLAPGSFLRRPENFWDLDLDTFHSHVAPSFQTCGLLRSWRWHIYGPLVLVYIFVVLFYLMVRLKFLHGWHVSPWPSACQRLSYGA